MCCERKKYAQYIEGIGTGIGVDDPMGNPNADIAKDNKHGFMFGAGKTGIRGKVRKGCKNLALKIRESKNDLPPNTKFTQLTIDVFGFSRGAAAARNFVYEVVVKEQETPRISTKREKVGYRSSRSFGNDGVIPIYENKVTYKDSDFKEVKASPVKDGKMPVRGLLGYYLIDEGVLSQEELEDLSVIIRSLGIYDTVSSYEETYDSNILLGVNKKNSFKHDLFTNDVEQLNLDALRVTKAVHFTAQDEHRKNFRLTRMKTGIEKNFPGVHCDIGGAYENETEVKTEIESNNHLSDNGLKDYRQHLINEYWYKDDQLEILKDNMVSALPGGKIYRYTAPYLNYKRLQGTRYIKKEYSYIPLQFMEKFFREQLADESFIRMPISCEDTYKIGENNGVLKSAYKFLFSYVFNNESEWKFVPDHILNPRYKRGKSKFNQLFKTGYSSVGSVGKAKTIKVNNKSQNEIFARYAVIEVLTGGTDPTGKAFFWDGLDLFTRKGELDHPKFKQYKSVTIISQHLTNAIIFGVIAITKEK